MNRRERDSVTLLIELGNRPGSSAWELHEATGVSLWRIYRLTDELMARGVVIADFVGTRQPRRREYRLSLEEEPSDPS